MISIRNLQKSYRVGDSVYPALKGVTLDLPSVGLAVIVGPSGCGKTTLLNLISGLDQPTAGTLLFDGVDSQSFNASDWNQHRNQTIGYVFQQYYLVPHLNVFENVSLPLRLRSSSSHDVDLKVRRALKVVGLDNKIEKFPNQLSGGEMQRVAIARAWVNQPKIILADEPTGALDTKNGTAIFRYLKALSKKSLVIVVSHERALADRYADYWVEMKDGKVIKSRLPQSQPVAKVAHHPIQLKASFLAPLWLSFRHLLTKKFRTLLMTVSGSIGIVSVALVLGLSNGFSAYINRLETDTLSGFPIMITGTKFEFDQVLTPEGTLDENHTEAISVYDQPYIGGHLNRWTDDYIDYVEALRDSPWVSSVKTRYSVSSNLAVMDDQGSVKLWQDDNANPLSSYTMINSSSWHELLGDEDFVLKYYDLVGASSVYPQNEREVVLIADAYNRIDRTILNNLGLLTDGDAETLPYASVIGKTMKIFNNDDFYTKNNAGSRLVNDWESGSLQLKYMTQYTTPTGQALHNLYQSEKGQTLTITGILRPKTTTGIQLMFPGVGYVPSLSKTIMEDNLNSEIVQAQRDNYYISMVEQSEGEFVPTPRFYSALSGSEISLPDYIAVSRKLGVDLSDHMVQTVLPLTPYANTLNTSLIVGMSIFPKTFSDKRLILQYLDDWNETLPVAQQMYYIDLAQDLTAGLGTLVTLSSSVLFTFSIIALFVSTLMIGIIVYISVVERIKEIGIYRAIGASSFQIANLFNSEGVLIGLAAGLLGWALAYALAIPTNLVLEQWFPNQGLDQLIALEGWLGATLTGTSVLLTLIASVIPAITAAKKDPIKALKTE